MKLQKGVKLNVFNWKVYISFNTFWDVKLESVIISALSKAKMGLKRMIKCKVFDLNRALQETRKARTVRKATISVAFISFL